jgi:hypothetical protein
VSLSREEIIRMAREVGEAEGMELVFHPVIERLANAAYAAGAAAEREACAQVCDAASVHVTGNLLRAGAIWCAVNIRARNGGDK